MIEFFDNPLAANAFCSLHPEWKPVSVSAGHTAGSVLVLFEARPDAIRWPPDDPDTVTDSMVSREPLPKRRGRPPKVKSA